jgi:predicted nucleic acid-binding protein
MAPCFATNVPVYLVDDEPEKQEATRILVQEYLIEGDGMISVQVRSKTRAASRKLSHALSEEQAREMVGYFAAFSPLPENVEMVLGAVRRSREYTLSLWDALIVESTLAAGVDCLLTEDLRHGQDIERLRIENPFL